MLWNIGGKKGLFPCKRPQFCPICPFSSSVLVPTGLSSASLGIVRKILCTSSNAGAQTHENCMTHISIRKKCMHTYIYICTHKHTYGSKHYQVSPESHIASTVLCCHCMSTSVNTEWQRKISEALLGTEPASSSAGVSSNRQENKGMYRGTEPWNKKCSSTGAHEVVRCMVNHEIRY